MAQGPARTVTELLNPHGTSKQQRRAAYVLPRTRLNWTIPSCVRWVMACPKATVGDYCDSVTPDNLPAMSIGL